MKQLLKPDLRYKSVESIELEKLKKMNIKYILLDLDNTIIDFDRHLSKTIEEWVSMAKENDFEIYILSNTNKYDKVSTVANKLNVSFINNARKPFKSGFNRAIKKFGIVPENTAMVGDQVLTDIVGGNRMNMVSVYVDPIAKREHFYTRWKRPLESWILKIYSE